MKLKYTLLPIYVATAYLQPVIAETVTEAFERAIQLQETEGDLKNAIEVYEQLIKEGSKQDDVTLEAHYRLAKCYLYTEEKKKAEAVLAKMKKNYSSSNPWVKKVIQLLGSDIPFLRAPFRTEGEYYGYDIKLPNGKIVGYMFGGIQQVEHQGETAWKSFFGRRGGEDSFTSCVFSVEDYRPIQGRNVFSNIGDFISTFQADGMVEFKDVSGKVQTKTVPLGDGVSAIFENDQTIHLIRAIDFTLGEEVSMQIVTPLAHGLFPFILNPVEYETVETPAGSFDCIKVETNINQTFYVSRDESRHMVKIEIGQAIVELAALEEWNTEMPTVVAASKIPVQIELPLGAFYYPEKDQPNRYRLRYYDPDFLTQHSLFSVQRNSGDESVAVTAPRELAVQMIEKDHDHLTEFEIIENSWEEMQIAGMDGILVITHQRRGKILTSTYHAYANGAGTLVALRSDFHEADTQAVREQMIKTLESIQIR